MAPDKKSAIASGMEKEKMLPRYEKGVQGEFLKTGKEG